MTEPRKKTVLSWIANAFQVAGLVVGVHWYFHAPAPGKAIGAVAVLAVVMTLHEGMRSWEKAGWLFLMCGLLAIEMLAITEDRKGFTHDFKALVDKVETSLGNTNTLLDETKDVLSKMQDVKTSVGAVAQNLSNLNKKFENARNQNDKELALNGLLLSAPQIIAGLNQLSVKCSGQPLLDEEIAKTYDQSRRQNLQRTLDELVASCRDQSRPLFQSAYNITEQLIAKLPDSQRDSGDVTALSSFKQFGQDRMVTTTHLAYASSYLSNLIRRIKSAG